VHGLTENTGPENAGGRQCSPAAPLAALRYVMYFRFCG